MKRRHQTNETNARRVVSAAVAPAGGIDSERGEGLTSPAGEAIARRAYELYLERGAEPGRETEDWFRAEADLRGGRQ